MIAKNFWISCTTSMKRSIFGGRVVKIKTRARGGFDAQLLHQRLIAMMPAAQGHAALVRHRHHVVRVNVVQQKAHQSRAADVRAEQADASSMRKVCHNA